MARQKKEEVQNFEQEVDFNDNLNFEIDDEAVNDMPMQEVEKEVVETTNINNNKPKRMIIGEDNQLINCLRKETIIVRFLPRKHGIWGNNPKHVLAGGMAESAIKTFVVPLLSSGAFKNVLTNSEKNYLEYIMGLEPNALSVYKKVDNFWSTATEGTINKVMLKKGDNRLDLSNPEDYIRYKILLANNDVIAPSLQALEDKPKATYQFVIIKENDEIDDAQKNMSITMKCYKEYGKIEEDLNKLRLIVEIIDGRPTAPTTKLSFIQTRINDIIQSNGKMFLKVVSDPLLDTKVLIKKCLEAGLIVKRGNDLYVREDNSPMCEYGESPTFNIAAKYLNNPKRQELKFSLEAKLK